MKVFQRVAVKTLILLLVIGVFGGGAACIRAYRQSTSDYAMDQYLSLLIDNNTEKAYQLLDQSEDEAMTQSEYEAALQAGKYSLYASYRVADSEKRQGTDGASYTDYHVEFLDTSGEVKQENDFTTKRQADAVLGMFDKWKVLSGHCMVQDFRLTVPKGSTVYLNGEEADASWMVVDGVAASADCYEIPSLLPGNVSLVIRHPVLESVNGTLDTSEGSADYTNEMDLKDSAKAECEELAVQSFRQLYTAAAVQETDGLEEIFADCLEEATALAEDQAEEFHQENAVFQSVGISDFAATFEGTLTTKMTVAFRYIVREDVTTDTGEFAEDGTPLQQTDTAAYSGTASAELTLAYEDDAWHITAVSMPVIPE